MKWKVFHIMKYEWMKYTQYYNLQKNKTEIHQKRHQSTMGQNGKKSQSK